jgi:phage gpG-like protein
MGVTIQGTERLAATMDDAGEELARLTDSHRQVAALVVRAMRPPRRTGRLQASIRPVPDQTAAQIEAGAPYAAVIEFGWRAHNIRPQPYFTKAIASTTARWEEIYIQGIQGVLDTVKGA